MDIRIKKTKQAIINTFIGLRAHKPLEKITIKELCEKAMINKSTFYSHYEDIYALANDIEDQVVKDILSQIQHPELAFKDLKKFNKELYYAFISQSSLIHTLFKDNRRNELVFKIKQNLKDIIFNLDEQYKNDPVANILLDYVINGGYYTFIDNISNYDQNLVINTMGELLEPIWNEVKDKFNK